MYAEYRKLYLRRCLAIHLDCFGTFSLPTIRFRGLAYMGAFDIDGGKGVDGGIGIHEFTSGRMGFARGFLCADSRCYLFPVVHALRRGIFVEIVKCGFG